MHSIFLSDLHLGNNQCNDDKLYKFLKELENDDGTYKIKNLFLVGDIIDMTEFNHKVFWSKHRKIIRKFFRMADKGVNIVYVIGNHDYYLIEEILHGQSLVEFQGISFCREYKYKSLTGDEFLLIHGDQFDGMVALNPILYKIGDTLYKLMHIINRFQNKIRKLFGKNEWSMALWLKNKTKAVVQFISNFKKLLVEKAKKENVIGIISGHIHKLDDVMIDDVRYLNAGTFCEFCSYIVEYEDGIIEAKLYE